MDVLVERCAGLDVHRDTVVATARIPPDAGERGSRVRVQHTRTFATTTAGITALSDWLAEHRVTRAGMESTGVYWKPVVRHEALGNRAGVRGLRCWSVAAGW
jgi:transposase